MNAIVKASAFANGDSVMVLLPKHFGIVPGTELELERSGANVIVRPRPIFDPVEEKRKVIELIEALRAIGPVGEVEIREPIEFPDRPGL